MAAEVTTMVRCSKRFAGLPYNGIDFHFIIRRIAMSNSTYAAQSVKIIAAPIRVVSFLNELFNNTPLGMLLAALNAPAKRR